MVNWAPLGSVTPMSERKHLGRFKTKIDFPVDRVVDREDDWLSD